MIPAGVVKLHRPFQHVGILSGVVGGGGEVRQ